MEGSVRGLTRDTVAMLAWKDERKCKEISGYSVFERGMPRVQGTACCGGSVLKHLSAVAGIIPLKDGV